MDEDLTIFLEDLLVYLDSEMTALTQLKTQINKILGTKPQASKERKWSWLPENIKWIKTTGVRGEYERFPLEGCRIEISLDYKNLLQDLKEHNCFLKRDGYIYWLFYDLATIGRKKEEGKA